MPNKREAFCLVCGKPFTYFIGYTSGKFCSRTCYNKAVAIPEKRCIICGELYTPNKGSKKQWEASKYCSIACANKGKLKGQFYKCDYCGQPVWKSPYDVKKHNFCSRRCYHAFNKGKHNTKNYKKGYRAEHEAMELLRADNYEVIRNFLSWGVWDIAAIGLDHIRFIQVKSSRKLLPISAYKKDIHNLIAYCVPDFASKELWVRRDYYGWTKYLITDTSIRLMQDNDLNNFKTNSIILLTDIGEGQRKINDCIITISQKKIQIIQCGIKTEEAKQQLREKYAWLNGQFEVTWEIGG